MAKKITDDGEIIDTVTHEVIAREPPMWKTPHNHDTNHESDAVALECKDPSRTQQSHAKDADINNILAKFMQGGGLPLTGPPQYMDVEEEFDLQSKMVTAYEVEQAWDKLPANVRNTLKDPKTFLEYLNHCMETGDLDPLRELGLAKPKAVPEAIIPVGGTPAPQSPDGAPSAPKS